MSEIYIVIVLGYLSILLGTLAQHPKIRARLLVPTSSAASDNKETILKCLARVIEEFVRANEVMDKLFEIHPEMVNNDDGWKGGLNGEEGGKRLETYQELRARLLLWNGM
ncbi:hypothetical protein BJ508DRAFT_98435 [Ascobolus immersus RN42]|uniref:Uncharacterized protein n=1 Tax=Ascobolus immersus RN42 TaxID=1160509 RepID=A0A3N4IRD1_ASCIM|nr:hypothetical protein BJ508DRAFT_98435 [Ascobolus immersus RN42]